MSLTEGLTAAPMMNPTMTPIMIRKSRISCLTMRQTLNQQEQHLPGIPLPPLRLKAAMTPHSLIKQSGVEIVVASK